jgi:hypothetical protein
MILSLGFSYYNIINRIEDSTQETIELAMRRDRAAADESLEIQSVELTGGNSLNLTIKNTGNVFSELEWIGVFDLTLDTQDYYRIDFSLNPIETEGNIGNSSILMNPVNTYRIQVLTKLGNIYYGEYPKPSTGGSGGSGGGGTVYYYVNKTSDDYAPAASGSHSLFSAMQAGPDYINNTISEAVSGGFTGEIADSVIDSLEFDTADARSPSVVHVSGDIYAIAYEGPGGDGWVTTMDIDSTGQIGASTISSYEFDTANGDTPEIIHISGDIYAIVYDSTGNDGFIKTIEIATNGVITPATIDTLEYDTGNGETPSIVHVSGDIYAIAYDGPGSDGWLATVEIAANGAITDTVVDSFEYDTTAATEPYIMHISGEYYAITYEDGTSSGILITVEIAANGAITNSVVDTWTFEGGQCDHPSIIPVSGDVYAIVYRGLNNDGDVATVEVSSTGVITKSLIDIFQFDVGNGNTPMITHVQGDYYAIVYTGGGNDGFVVTVEITTAGAITKAVVDTLEFAPSDGIDPFVIPITSSVYAVAYRGAGGDGFITTFEFEGGSYELDLEVAWVDLPTKTNEYLTIYGGTMGLETLEVDYWNGATWVNIIPSVSPGYNVLDVSPYLTGSAFTIRFVDSDKISDSSQDSWVIDAVYLHLFD